MSTRSAYEPGTPCWVDLMSPDMEASTTFYTGLFGWESDDQFDDDGTRIYTNFRRDGQLVAGMGAQQPGMEGVPATWSTYVATADVDATVAAVARAGGTVMMPTLEVMDQGRMAIFADPSGAVVSAWEPGAHHGADVVNEPGAWSWNELMTRDLDAALAFYRAVFGWEYEGMPMPDGTYHVVVGGDEGGLGGLMAMPRSIPDAVPSHWAVYFTVDDISAVLDRAGRLGATVLMGPTDAGDVGTIATLADPQGGSFMVLQPATPA